MIQYPCYSYKTSKMGQDVFRIFPIHQGIHIEMSGIATSARWIGCWTALHEIVEG